jgi:hypothetical protein
MITIVASRPSRARVNDLPQYVRKFRFESADSERLAPESRVTMPSANYGLIWLKVLLMSIGSTGLLYVAVSVML